MKKLASLTLSVVLMLSMMGLNVYASPASIDESAEIVYQNEDYTIVARIMTPEQADSLYQQIIDTRGADVIPIPEIPQNAITPRTLRTVSASKSGYLSGLKERITITCSATPDVVSNQIKKITSTRIKVSTNSVQNNSISYYDSEYSIVDGGRTGVINYVYDVDQVITDLWNNSTTTYYGTGAVLFEIYYTGTGFIY